MLDLRMSLHQTTPTTRTALRAHVRYGIVTLLLLAQLWVVAIVQAQQAVPELTGHVIDQTNTLSSGEIQALSNKILAYEQAKGSQIVVLMVQTTQPEDIAAYAHRVASTWKIGRRDVGDGVLIVVAKNDRRMRIEVAKDVEGAIPDLMAARIIDTGMKPRFRAGDFAGGLTNAVDMITARLDGEELPAVSTQRKQKEGADWVFLTFAALFASVFVGSILKAIMGRGLGSVVTGVIAGVVVFIISGVFLTAVMIALFSIFITWRTTNRSGMSRGGAPIILGGGGWGNDSDDFGGGGFGGGGWGSGGGGDFGGGGASGDW